MLRLDWIRGSGAICAWWIGKAGMDLAPGAALRAELRRFFMCEFDPYQWDGAHDLGSREAEDIPGDRDNFLTLVTTVRDRVLSNLWIVRARASST